MIRLATLSSLGAALFVGAVAGVQLGDSAIAEIHPIHFQGPALHPRERGAAIEQADLAAPSRPAYATLYGWDEGYAARDMVCCDAPVTPRAYQADERYDEPYEEAPRLPYDEAAYAVRAAEVAVREEAYAPPRVVPARLERWAYDSEEVKPDAAGEPYDE